MQSFERQSNPDGSWDWVRPPNVTLQPLQILRQMPSVQLNPLSGYRFLACGSALRQAWFARRKICSTHFVTTYSIPVHHAATGLLITLNHNPQTTSEFSRYVKTSACSQWISQFPSKEIGFRRIRRLGPTGDRFQSSLLMTTSKTCTML